MQLPREVIVGKGTLPRIKEVVQRLDIRGSALIIAGAKSCEIAGKQVRDLLEQTGMNVDTLLVETATIRDVLMVEERIKAWHPRVLFAVGGGTKIDAAKLSSARQDIPFFSVPTTVSHDGIASPLASVKGLDKPYSVMAQAPLAIIADTDVIAQAPWRSVISGCGDVIAKFPPRVLGLGEPVGKVRPDVASVTGLSKDTLVVQGGADAYIGVLGLGAVRAGRVAFITGSSHLLLGHTEKELHKSGVFGAFPDAVMPGLWVVEGAQISTGSVLKWFKDSFICQAYADEAARRGISLYDHLNGLAEKIKIGSEGLIVLNYWQGNRNPLTDSQARGVIWGLSLKHTPVHVYRAIMEAVSYGMEHIMRHFREAGFTPREVYACGGATKSRLWMRMQSDVLGIPIYLTAEPNAPLLGDAILASFGAGVYGSIEEAADRMVKIREKIEPDPANTERYRYYVDKYIATYPPLKDLMHDMVRHETEA